MGWRRPATVCIPQDHLLGIRAVPQELYRRLSEHVYSVCTSWGGRALARPPQLVHTLYTCDVSAARQRVSALRSTCGCSRASSGSTMSCTGVAGNPLARRGNQGCSQRVGPMSGTAYALHVYSVCAACALHVYSVCTAYAQRV